MNSSESVPARAAASPVNSYHRCVTGIAYALCHELFAYAIRRKTHSNGLSITMCRCRQQIDE
eukprot:1637301-Pleurochrysis_carterae.AAC.2